MGSGNFTYNFLRYNPDLKQKWREGRLQREWREAYHQLFDDDDLSLALNQIPMHFGEWFAAIHYFKKGWSVFMEHYVYSREKANSFYAIREEKKNKVKQLLGTEGFDFLRNPYLEGKKRRIRPPDLFIFKDRHRFFFAEVKWGKDKLRDYQKTLFGQISEKFGTNIEVVDVVPIQANPTREIALPAGRQVQTSMILNKTILISERFPMIEQDQPYEFLMPWYNLSCVIINPR